MTTWGPLLSRTSDKGYFPIVKDFKILPLQVAQLGKHDGGDF